MPTKLKPDFTPSDDVARLLSNRYGVRVEQAREFMGHQLPVFILHFTGRDDAKALKSNWNTCFYNWCARSYEDNKEQIALHRAQAPQQGNIFEQALNSINKEKPVERPTRARVVSTPIPGEGETMSADDALKVLAGMHR